MKKMNSFACICFSNLLIYAAFANKNPDWVVCKHEDDCVLVGSCQINSVNKKYQKEADIYYVRQEVAMSCESNHVKHYKPSCVNGGCQPIAKIIEESKK